MHLRSYANPRTIYWRTCGTYIKYILYTLLHIVIHQYSMYWNVGNSCHIGFPLKLKMLQHVATVLQIGLGQPLSEMWDDVLNHFRNVRYKGLFWLFVNLFGGCGTAEYKCNNNWLAEQQLLGRQSSHPQLRSAATDLWTRPRGRLLQDAQSMRRRLVAAASRLKRIVFESEVVVTRVCLPWYIFLGAKIKKSNRVL